MFQQRRVRTSKTGQTSFSHHHCWPMLRIFGHTIVDMLSGYHVFSGRFVKSSPVLPGGFEIETELALHAIQLGVPIVEVRKTPLLREAEWLSFQARHMPRRVQHPGDS